jgi:hypothetical protein
MKLAVALLISTALWAFSPVGMAAEPASEKVAIEMARRLPVVMTPLPDQRIESGRSLWVGVPDARISFNKTAPREKMGNFYATVRTRTEEALMGFIGCVEFRLLDKDGNVIYALLTPQYGVNATGLRWVAAADRRDTFDAIIPFEVLTAVAKIEPHARRCEDPAYERAKKTVEDLQKGVEVVKDGLKKIGASTAEIAAIVRGSS